VNQFLLWIGDLFATTLSFVIDGATWVGETIDAVIAPVLSPLLTILNPIANAAGKTTFDALSFLPKWASLALLSSLLGVVMLFVFKYLSNQKAIARVKDDISANLLALKLYKDELRVTAITQVRLLWAVLRLQRYMLTPVLITLPPMLLLLGQMGTYYQWDALPVNQATLLRVSLSSQDDAPRDLTLQTPESIRVEAGPIASQSDVVWRLTPLEPGIHTVTLAIGDDHFSKLVMCGTTVARVSALRPTNDWMNQLLHPIEKPIRGDAGIHSIELDYPKAPSWFCGGDYWVVSLFVISMIVALLLKSVVGVRF